MRKSISLLETLELFIVYFISLFELLAQLANLLFLES